jgi:hypothetical protein
MKKLFSIFSICFIFLACQTAVAQLKEDYVNIAWKFKKCEPSNPNDPELAAGKKDIEFMFNKLVLTFNEDDTYEWKVDLLVKGTFQTDPEDMDYIILTPTEGENLGRPMRFKLAMRNYNKELILALRQPNDSRSMDLIFTR